MKKKRGIAAYLILLICVAGMSFCGYNIFKIYKDYNTSKKEYDDLTKKVITVKEEKEIPVVIPEDFSYPYAEINFDELHAINEDIVGWIRVSDTKLNYPILHGKTNDDYIHHTPEKKYTSAGSIFLDSRNAPDFSDFNSVLYGHNMNDGSMFALLKKYLKQDFLDEHKYIEIYTPKAAKVYSIVSIYISNYQDDAYTFQFKGLANYKTWLEKRVSMNLLKTMDYSVNKNSIVLSTCHGANGTDTRLILILQECKDIEPLYH